jgi:hypothetical protein
LAALDSSDPWPVSNQVRSELETDYFFVPVGGSWSDGTRLAQTALLIPRSPAAPTSVFIQTSESGIDVRMDQFGFWIIVLSLVAGWYLVFSYSRRWLLGSGPNGKSATT